MSNQMNAIGAGETRRVKREFIAERAEQTQGKGAAELDLEARFNQIERKYEQMIHAHRYDAEKLEQWEQWRYDQRIAARIESKRVMAEREARREAREQKHLDDLRRGAEQHQSKIRHAF